MKPYLILAAMLPLVSACGDRDTNYGQQGVKLEDAQNKDIIHNSPLPNASPDTPPSEISASPTGQSMGDSPYH